MTSIDLAPECTYCGGGHDLADHRLLIREGSGIEWTQFTFNPWWGCTKVAGSRACVYCYAEAWARRVGHSPTGKQPVIWGARADRRFMSAARWRRPHMWNAEAERLGCRYKVFCASMADIFENYAAPNGPDGIAQKATRRKMDAARAGLWELIETTPHLDWLLLTKRPENIRGMVPAAWLRERYEPSGLPFSGHFGPSNWRRLWPANAWVGTTVEDQAHADERIPHLLKVPAPVRFLSIEPMVGPVDLNRPGWLEPAGRLQAGPINWVIVGGESGAGHRSIPLDPNDVRSLARQCAAADVPFLFKQWGDWMPYEAASPPFWQPADGGPYFDGHELPFDISEGHVTRRWWAPDITDDVIYHHAGQKGAGRTLDGRTYDATPRVLPARPDADLRAAGMTGMFDTEGEPQ